MIKLGLCILILSILGCGQTGPLYLPEKPPKNETPISSDEEEKTKTTPDN